MMSNQNQKALTDSVRTMTNKVGDIEYAKNILITEKKNLSELNEELAKELKKESGRVYELTKYVNSISNTNSKGEIDTVYLTNTLIKYADGSNGLEWSHDTVYDSQNERRISGISKFSINESGIIKPLETLITKDVIKFNIIQGLREKDGNLEMFVRSDYPNFLVSELNSAIIDPKKHPILKKFIKPKRFGLGPYVGFGLSQEFKFNIQFGFGINYSFFRF